MKVYIPRHTGGAGLWIYEGYKAAWAAEGFQSEYIDGIPTDTPDQYDAMLVEGALCHESMDRILPFLEKARKVYMFVQPTSFPEPWVAHPNFRSSSTDFFIEEINGLDNVTLWSFTNSSGTGYYDKWKFINYVPLAFDDINYNPVEDSNYNFDICYIGGWANNGFNEKKRILEEYLLEIDKLGLRMEVCIDRGISLQQEANLLFNSKIAINLHDKYQQVLGLDTNERTFKSLGLTGFMISDRVKAVGELFPEVPTGVSAKEMSGLIKKYMDYDLEGIKEKNRELILRDHTYRNRVTQMLYMNNES